MSLFAPKERNLVEEFPFWELSEGVMVLQDGRGEVGVELFLGPTLFFPQERISSLVGAIRALLRGGVPQGEKARLIVEGSPAPLSLIEEYERLSSGGGLEAARLLAEDRGQLYRAWWSRGEILARRVFLTVSFGKKRPRLLPFGSSEFKDFLEEGRRLREALVSLLFRGGFKAKPMEDDDVFNLLLRYLNPGLLLERPLSYRRTWQRYPRKAVERLPGLRPPTLRAQLLRSEVDNSRRETLVVGDRYLSILLLYTIPDETYEEMGDLLLRAGGEHFYLVMDFVHEPYEKALKALKARARRFYAASANAETYVDPNVRVGLSETEATITYVSQAGDHVYRFGLSLILIDRDRENLARRVSAVQSELASVPGSPFRLLRNGLFSPWKRLCPFSGGFPEEWIYLVETNAAHFFPLSGTWRGSSRPVALFLSRSNTLVSLDPFDSRVPSWNVIIAGGTGSGKTFTVQRLLSELLRLEDVQVIILDRGRNYEALIRAMNGVMIDVRPGAEFSVNPFDLEEGETEPSQEKKGDVLRFIRAMVPSPEDKTEEAVENAILEAAIDQTYKRATQDIPLDGDYTKVERRYLGARLSDLVRTLTLLDEIGNRPAREEEKRVAASLALRLQSWVGDTPLGSFVDRETNVPIATTRVVCYELEGLEAYPGLDVVGTMLIADLVWKRAKLGKRLGRTVRTVVVLDEAWKLFKNPYAAQMIEELYRRFRHLGGAVWSITQSLQDFTGESAGRILQNTRFHYLLFLPGEEAYIQRVLGLSDRAMAVHRTVATVPGKYSEILFFMKLEDRMEGEVLRVVPTLTDYWVFTSAAADRPRKEETIRRFGGDVVKAARWLAGGGA